MKLTNCASMEIWRCLWRKHQRMDNVVLLSTDLQPGMICQCHRLHWDSSRINWRQYYVVRLMRHDQALSCMTVLSVRVAPYKCSDWLTYLLTYHFWWLECYIGAALMTSSLSLNQTRPSVILHIVTFIAPLPGSEHLYLDNVVLQSLSGPSAWINLPWTPWVFSTTLDQFQCRLKTILFRLAY